MHLRIDESASCVFALRLLVREHSDDADGTSCREEVCAIDTDCGPRLLVTGLIVVASLLGSPSCRVLGLQWVQPQGQLLRLPGSRAQVQ